MFSINMWLYLCFGALRGVRSDSAVRSPPISVAFNLGSVKHKLSAASDCPVQLANLRICFVFSCVLRPI